MKLSRIWQTILSVLESLSMWWWLKTVLFDCSFVWIQKHLNTEDISIHDCLAPITDSILQVLRTEYSYSVSVISVISLLSIYILFSIYQQRFLPVFIHLLLLCFIFSPPPPGSLFTTFHFSCTICSYIYKYVVYCVYLDYYYLFSPV